MHIERAGRNTRRIQARIGIAAPLEILWGVLTDYARLAEFIPSLATNEVLEPRTNGARLLQVGEQDLALGLKFSARATMDVEEMPERCSEDGQRRRDICFNMVEGDFKVFKGTWSLSESTEEGTLRLPEAGPASVLSYFVEVTPHPWLPVWLIEGRISNEICINLTSVRAEAQRRAGGMC